MTRWIFWCFLIAIISMVLFPNCHKQEEPDPPPPVENLPAKTTEGKNTVGCYVNGKPYIKCCELLDCNPIFGNGPSLHVNSGYPTFKSIDIDSEDRCSEDTTYQLETLGLSFWLDSLNQPFANHVSYRNYDSSEKLCIDIGEDFRYHDTLSPINYITITKFDETNRIVSGVFQFDLFTPDCTDTIHLRDGRFDVRF